MPISMDPTNATKQHQQDMTPKGFLVSILDHSTGRTRATLWGLRKENEVPLSKGSVPVQLEGFCVANVPEPQFAHLET